MSRTISDPVILVSREALCIDDRYVTSLKELAKKKKIKTYTARKVGELIDVERQFAAITIKDKLHFACLTTGSIFDEYGKHNNSHSLHVIGLPSGVVPGVEVQERKNGPKV